MNGDSFATMEFNEDLPEKFYWMKELLDNLPGGLAIFEVFVDSIRTRYLSDGVYDLLGYDSSITKEQKVDPMKLVFNEDMLIIRRQMELIQQGNKSIDCIFRVVTIDGKIRWFNLRGIPIRKEADAVIVNAVLLDITEKKHTEEIKRIYEKEMQVAVSKLRKRICEYDLASKTLYIPTEYADVYGLPTVLQNVPNNSLNYSYISERDRTTYFTFFDRILSGEKTGSMRVCLQRKDGEWYWEQYEFVTVFGDDGRARKAVISVEDITEQQKIKSRYEHERQLRRELIGEYVICYELNLTKNEIIECLSPFETAKEVIENKNLNETLKNLLDNYVDKNDRKAVQNMMSQSALLKAYKRGETSLSIEYKRKLPDLGTYWVQANSALMKMPETDDIVAFIYVRNIDIEKKEQFAIRNILQEEIGFISIYNFRTGIIHFVRNTINLEEFGTKNNELFEYKRFLKAYADKAVLDIDRESFLQFFEEEPLMKRLLTESTVSMVYRINENGQILRKCMRAAFLDETQEDIIFFNHDITQLHKVEQQQKEKLQEAMIASEKANRAKSEFISRMSHDMRTPLNAILSLSSEELIEDVDVAQKNDYLKHIHYSGKYLLGIINDVLDMSRIESGKIVLNPEPYSIEDFTQTIETVIGDTCRQKGLKFHFSIHGKKCQWALLDRIHFEQIFINLLSNAVKFTNTGGTIDLKVETLEFTDEIVKQRFLVCDSGIGMSPEFLPHAFESFAQEKRKNESENYQGTGLDLAIVKQSVELMGGTITVESEIGKGTKFTIELAYKPVPAPEETTTEVVHIELLEGCRILLCEDNLINCHIIKALLEKKGAILEWAENGEDGLEMFRKSEQGYYNIILILNP